MADINTMLDIIRTGLPILASSTVLNTLIKTVEAVIKTLYMPTLTLKNGKAQVDVETYRKQQEGIISNQTFTLYEITKLKNFINTANFAAKELENCNEQTSKENIDFDWIMRFFDAVSNVNNAEMQKLWGKILAGEIKHPGACSLRTMDIVYNMSKNEAKTFNKLCEYVVTSGDCYFIFHQGFLSPSGYNNDSSYYISKSGLNYSDNIIPMIESGLLSVDNDLVTDFKTNNVLTIQNQDIVCLIVADKSKENYISIEPYFLTRSGIELYNIIQGTPEFKPDNEYPLICFEELKEIYSNLSFSAHKIIKENKTNVIDTVDLLLEH